MRANTYHQSVVALLGALLLLPIAATGLYSLSSEWGATILPQGLSLRWYLELWRDPRFLTAFGHSLAICLSTLLVSALIIVPAAFVTFYRFPGLKRWMNILILMPFAVPPVVSSVGLLQLYSSAPLPLVGSPWVLIGCYFTIVLPFIYRALANTLGGMPLRDLMDAAHLLGADTPLAFLSVILPNLKPALMASLFLSFSFLLGEFVFANMLVGTRYETLQVYLYNVRQTSGHFTSAIVMSYFLFTLALTWLAAKLGR